MFQKIGEALLDLVYPRSCVGCGRGGTLLCAVCLTDIDFYFLPVQLHLDPTFIDQYLVVARLEGVVRKMIHQLKYNQVKELGTIVGKLLYLCSDWPDADMVTAVPLHAHRLAERGFNQAAVIGQSFAQLAGIPYGELLVRTVDTPHQAQQTTRAERERNITEYFSLKNSTEKTQQFSGKHIILVDDVCTTGVTLNQCAKVLKENGCSQLTALTLAHGH